MTKVNTTPNEILGQFFARLEGARKTVIVGSTPAEKVRALRRALAASGITKAVANDVLNVPADWWWSEELKVYLPPVSMLPPLEGVLRRLPAGTVR